MASEYSNGLPRRLILDHLTVAANRFEDWYAAQPDRKLVGSETKQPVRIENCSAYESKRGLRKGAKYTLEFALMADGVPVKDVYKVLATKDGQNRAFRKLDQLKPHIQWWEAGAQPPQFLASGDVVMSSAYNGRIAAVQALEGQRHALADLLAVAVERQLSEVLRLWPRRVGVDGQRTRVRLSGRRSSRCCRRPPPLRPPPGCRRTRAASSG